MEMLQLIEEIEDLAEKSFSVFSYILVNRDDLLQLTNDIRLKFPEELKQAKWVKEERARIISEAEKEAEEIIRSAKEQVISLIDEHEIARAAREKGEKLMQSIREDDYKMRQGAVLYADSMLEKVEALANDILEEVRISREDLKRNQVQPPAENN